MTGRLKKLIEEKAEYGFNANNEAGVNS